MLIAPADGPLGDPVLGVRAARVTLDGLVDDPSGDLAERRLRLIHPDGFRRRPEALLHLARLAARADWSVDPATRAAAEQARVDGAPGTAPLLHLGFAAAPLLASPEAPAALRFLQDLRPDAPLAEGVVVDTSGCAPPWAPRRPSEPTRSSVLSHPAPLRAASATSARAHACDAAMCHLDVVMRPIR